MQPKTRQYAEFALAGVAYFGVAHVLYFLCNYFLLKAIGAPARLGASGVYMYCEMRDRFIQSHSGWRNLLLEANFLIVLLVFSFVGVLILKSSNIRRRSVLWWCAVLFLGTPLFVSADAFSRIYRFGLSFNYIWFGIGACSLTIGLVTYFKVFNREERKFLWLISLPLLVVTYFAWYFVIAKWVQWSPEWPLPVVN